MAKHVLSPEEQQREQLMLRELKKFHREHAYLGAPLGTSLTKKRVRVPRVDAEVNPFCMDRQIADGYEQINFNKNPRFYINAIKNSPRIEENPHNHSSFINGSADLLASSGFSPRVRAEFQSAVPAIAYRPTDYSPPGVVSVDSSGLRTLPKSHPLGLDKQVVHTTSTHAPPTHAHYSAQRSTLSVSFGHRPESASRMYDPLTSTVVRGKKTTKMGKQVLAPVSGATKPRAAGMSASELQELLTPSKPKQQQPLPSTSSPETLYSTRSPGCPAKASNQMAKTQHDESEQDRIRARDELEKGYNNETYYPPKQKKEIRFQPPTDQTTAQLIDKFRKLAVGKMPEM